MSFQEDTNDKKHKLLSLTYSAGKVSRDLELSKRLIVLISESILFGTLELDVVKVCKNLSFHKST